VKLIGVAGRRRAGKNTAERFIKEIMPQLQSIALGDRLKQVCSAYFDIPLGEFYDDKGKKKFYPEYQMTVREMMTSMADAMKAQYGTYCWLRPVRVKYEEMRADGAYGMIITDVRFQYEADWIRSEGGVVCHVSNSRTDAEAGEHNSEKGILFLSGDEGFLNEGSLEYLRTQCHTFAVPYRDGV
jgi:hypothetical protein